MRRKCFRGWGSGCQSARWSSRSCSWFERSTSRGDWNVTTSGSTSTWTARNSTAGWSPWPKKYLAIQEWIEADASLPYFSALFDPEITDYYCWTIPKGGQLIVGAALQPRDETSDKFDRLKGKLGEFGFRLGNTVRREGTFLLRPTRTGLDGFEQRYARAMRQLRWNLLSKNLEVAAHFQPAGEKPGHEVRTTEYGSASCLE
jgi:hypothetical protein